MDMAAVTRDEATRRIAGHIAGRDAFIVLGGRVQHAHQWLRQLAALPDWHVYFDDGSPSVFRVGGPLVPIALVADQLSGTASVVVAVVPKTVPATALGAALGLPGVVPADGSRDLVVLQGEGGVDWPDLFLEALAEVDPAAAAQIYASGLTRQS